MEKTASELYQKCYDHIHDYCCKPTSTNAIWNFPACADFQYGLNSFSICFGSRNCVYIEYEANNCSSGWNTCETFEDFKKLFDAFAVSCFDSNTLDRDLQLLSLGNRV